MVQKRCICVRETKPNVAGIGAKSAVLSLKTAQRIDL
jgi:hypothetical protein